MIQNTYRGLWIGASDTPFVIANESSHGTPTWQKWWALKTGFREGQSWKNIYTLTGDVYERSIVTAYNEAVEFDKCLEIPDLSLRANLDANTLDKIIEAKTYNYDKGIPDKRGSVWRQYYNQVQVQMFAWKTLFGYVPKAEVRFYGVNEEDYNSARISGIALPLDADRLESRHIQYDEYFIEEVYLPKLRPLGEQLKKIRESMGIR